MTTWHRQPARRVVQGVAFAVFVICCVLPVAFLVFAGSRASVPYAELLLDARQRSLLVNTAFLGMGTAVGASAIGVPLGILLARVPVRPKAFLRFILAVPLLLPPYIVAFAWLFLGRHWVIAGHNLSAWISNTPGAILILSLVFYPLSMLITEVAARSVDGRLEEAASLIASPGRVFRRITLPLAFPGILAAGLLVLVLSVSEFGVPALLQVRVYTTEVFTAFAALYDTARAMLLSIPLLVLCVCVSAISVLLVGPRVVTSAWRTAGAAPLLPVTPFAATAACLIVVGFALGLPIAALATETLTARSPGHALVASRNAIANSLIFAVVGATAVVGVGLWLGYARARIRPTLGRVVDALFVMLFAVPGTIIGIGLIELWNRPGPLGVIYGTDGMFLLAALGRFLPLAGLVLAAAAQSVPVSHEEAAAVGGAGWPRTMGRIVLPQMRLGIAAAWIIVFVLIFGELGVSILVAPPGEATLPIRVYTLIANAPPSQIAILALLQAMVIVVVGLFAFLMVSLARRESR